MKIGYICNQDVCVSGESNGIRMQALIWRDELIKRGHDVVLINTWGSYDWKSFDIIHAFGWGDSTSLLKNLKSRGVKTVCSPIIDSSKNKFIYRLNTKWGCEKLRLSSPGYQLRQDSTYVDLFLARTEFEAEYIRDCIDIPSNRLKIVPLSYRSEVENIDFLKKEDFCLHVSSITQERKNVMRLIQAAIKYKFNLVLAGSTNPQPAFEPLKRLIDANDNITCLGFVSEEKLEELYTKAKVFALPSLNEGVGLVALEAAMHGCDIVITNVGGPKEYYSDKLAKIINPLSIDEIGNAVIDLMHKSNQPMLKNHIKKHYNIGRCIDNLEHLYLTL